METTEKIVEAYCRYVNNWFTMPNIKCNGQFEIDLLAVDIGGQRGIKRYHIESTVSISGAYSKITLKPFSQERLKIRGHIAEQRRTLGYFLERKFEAQGIREKLDLFGFKEGNYSKVIVAWDWKPEVEPLASQNGITLWRFGDILKEIAKVSSLGRTYFTDDTLRTIQLFQKALDDKEK